MVKSSHITILSVLAMALGLAACQGAAPEARNPNGTLALADAQPTYQRTTAEQRAFYATPACTAKDVGKNGCDVVLVLPSIYGGADAAGSGGR